VTVTVQERDRRTKSDGGVKVMMHTTKQLCYYSLMQIVVFSWSRVFCIHIRVRVAGLSRTRRLHRGVTGLLLPSFIGLALPVVVGELGLRFSL
jgi:hypothetical protein